MRKIVCPACGLVNLDRFVSFPFCAGCGARLPEAGRRSWRDTLRRPVQTLVWVVPVGVAVGSLALVSAEIARETRVREHGQLSVISRASRAPDGSGKLRLGLRLESPDPTDTEPLRLVRVRVASRQAKSFALQVRTPRPDAQQNLGSGFYFTWRELRLGSTVRFEVRPPARFDKPLRLRVSAEGFTPLEVRLQPGPLQTKARPTPTKPSH